MLSTPDPSLPLRDEDAFTRPTFETLYAVARSYLPEALRLSRVPTQDVDDIVHDAVIVAHQGIDRYAPRAGPQGARPDSRRSLKAWLSAIAWRLAARRRGRAYRRFELPQSDADDLARPHEEAPTAEHLAAVEQRRKILAGIVHKLRPERAEVLLMHTFLEMSVPDIAEELGLNPNTVKSRIARARADAIAAVKRLSHDEQSVLEGSLLMLPLGLPTPGRERPQAPMPVTSNLPGSVRVSPMGLAAGAAGVLALGMAVGAGLTAPDRRPADAAPITAAREPAFADVSSVEPAAPPIPGPAVVSGAPSASTAPSASAAPARLAGEASRLDSRSLARELVWITAARRALHEGAGDRALRALEAHAREFPRGVLARERELLKERARAVAGAP